MNDSSHFCRLKSHHMSIKTAALPAESLTRIGIHSASTVHYQLSPEELINDTLRLGEGSLSDTGALVIETGTFTGRSPKDKFIIRDSITADTINWNPFNIPLEEACFDIIHKKALRYINSLDECWVRDCYACADPSYRLRIRVLTEKPWANLFAYNMFLRPGEEELDNFHHDWLVISLPGLLLDPKESGTRQPNASVISFKHKMIIIAGSGYTGEIKKGVFTILNYILPLQKNVLPMHCSANSGEDGNTAVFFGLSGTGKTTLSADPGRRLIGDDEHGWTDGGVFNFEGGCYAKCINLNEEKEPEIFNAIHHGALVENTVYFDGTRTINFEDSSITENTRVSYPLYHIGNALQPSVGKQPDHIFFLTCDAFGVLPPIAKLSTGQAMYQFISGYTAKIAGTEADVTEPIPTFSACFGAPFMPLHPGKYAAMLGKKMEENNVQVWLINTGWTGGPYGQGHRIKLAYTRAMITAAMNGLLETEEYENHPVFGIQIPRRCPGVPVNLMNPRYTWADRNAYDRQAKKLAGLFIENFKKYTSGVSPEVIRAAPKF